MFTTLTTNHYQQIIKLIVTLINAEVFEKEILQLLKNIIDFDKGIFVVLGKESSVEQIYDYHMDEGFLKEYVQKCNSIDPVIDYKNRAASESVADQTRIMDVKSTNPIREPIQCRNFYCKYDINFCLMFSINERGDGIRLYRTGDSPNFTKEDYEICKYLSSFIGDVYKHYALDMEIKYNARLYKMIKSNMYFGVLLFDDNFNLMSYNKIGIDRLNEITHKLSLSEMTSDIVATIKEMLKNEAKLGQNLTIYKITDYYIIELLINRDLDTFGNINTNYIVFLYGKAWFGSILTMSAEKVIEKYGLTEREKQLVTLILQGFSNLQISEKLFISTYTVKEHVKSIFRKMNLKSRGELIIKVYTDRGQDLTTIK